jgi:acyl-CoA synthetase (AMP-forming)/AMP-acid ligase II/thioesterase domain-containing protein/acyl carrier protein
MAAQGSPVQVEGFLDELRARAAEAPDSIALLAPGQKPIAYRELVVRTEALARPFAELGLKRTDVVAFILPDGVDFVALLLAIPSVAIGAPLNPAFTKNELETILAKLGARALIVERADCTAAAVARAAGCEVLEWTEMARGAGCGPEPEPERPAPDDVAILIHTSATTGGAKVVPLTHLNLRVMAANTRRMLGLSPADRLLSMMPLFHAQGMVAAVSQLLAGGSVIAMAGFDARYFLSWIEELRPTWYTAGPALHSAILPLVQKQLSPREGTALRFVRSIGAALPHDLMDALESALGVPVLEGYGMTETGLVTSNAPLSAGRKRGSAGRRGGEVEVGIMDESGALVPAPHEGQIVVRGAAVVQSYFHDAEATSKAFRDGWFLTGDIGRLDEQGFLFVTGRIKEIINRGGEKIIPAEVDAVLAAHPAVAEAAAFGVVHPTLGEDIVAAVVLRTGETVSEQELRRFAAERLALFKVPRRIFFREAIPKGPTGKPRREALAGEIAPLLNQITTVAGPPDAPAAAIEEQIAEIWKRILGVQEIGGRDDFFSVGGDSFSALLMLTEVEQEFGLAPSQLEEPDFFLNPDVATLARIVLAAASAPPERKRRVKSALVALQPKGARVPIFCFPAASENPYDFRLLAQALGNDQPFFVVRDPRPLAERGVYTVEEAAARFANAICEARKGGPYILGGRCYGGIFAFEVARQLMARGEEVGMVVLIEVPAPGYPKLLRHWKDYARQGWSMLRRGRLPGWAEVGSHIKMLRQRVRIRSAMLGRRLLLRAGLKRLVAPLEKVDHPHRQAGRSYRPKQLACDVVQIIAADELHSSQILADPRLGWREFTQGRFTVCQTPGRAAEILRQPRVKELAGQLSSLLDGINARSRKHAIPQ